MLWKTVNAFFQFFRRSSITARLTLFYSLSAFVILSIASGFLYWILVSNLQHENEKFLVNEVAVLRNIIFHRADNISALIEETQEVVHNRYKIRILNGKHQEVFISTNMNIPVFYFANINQKNAEQDSKNNLHFLRKSHYLLMTALAPIANTNEVWQIQIGLDIHPENNIIREFTNNLLWVLIISIFCFLAIGIIVAQQGIRPLYDIAKTARRITIEQLHERLDPASWPSEITVLAKSFNKMLDRIESSFKRLSQFSADLAHELRTPINNLMGEAEIALSRARTAEEYRHVIESSIEEYTRLSHMIENLLFIARSDNAKTVLQYQLFNIKEILLGIIDYYDALSAEKNTKIILQGDTILLNADLTLFRRAVNNLLSNAFKNTPKNGQICVEISKPGSEHVAVSIRDNGIGIASEHLPKLFDRFYRVDAARSKDAGGTGLGLAIVKSIMDLHQGKISIHSQEGMGTCVMLIFPNHSA